VLEHAIIVMLCFAVWCYSLVAVHNGGGPVTTVAILVSIATAIIASVYFIIVGPLYLSWIVMLAVAAILVLNLGWSPTSGNWIGD